MFAIIRPPSLHKESEIIFFKKSRLTPATVFTTLNLWMGPISKTVCLCQAFLAWCSATLSPIWPSLNLQGKWIIVNMEPTLKRHFKVNLLTLYCKIDHFSTLEKYWSVTKRSILQKEWKNLLYIFFMKLPPSLNLFNTFGLNLYTFMQARQLKHQSENDIAY
jgi:hypothetical protein